MKIGVFKQDEFMGYYNTRDISLEGLFFQMMPRIVNPNDVVGLLLSINGEAYLQKGFVVHASSAGVGIMLIEPDKQVLRALVSLYNGHKITVNHIDDGCDRQSLPERRLPRLVETQDQIKIRLRAPQLMQEARIHTPYNGLTVKIGTHFDISSSRFFNQMIKSIRSISPKILVIDLIETQHLFDSGLALLMLLQQQAFELENRIYLINGNSKIVDALSASSVTKKLHIL